ncbi:Tat pathway signal protein [Teredinibacter haidensis]|uniref:Tat pathway signal protein n=1 Tax=Teredinibacter haidensis TaxID=2731755 RepID=UPI000B00ED0D|nr:Tat pathway signal protein [Teredinibacter haidensis]
MALRRYPLSIWVRFLVLSLSLCETKVVYAQFQNGGLENDTTKDGASYSVLAEEDIVFGDEFDFVGDESEEISSGESKRKTFLGGSRKFIYQHDYAYIFTDPKEVGSNRSSLRFQWNRVAFNRLYLNVDIKPIIYFSGDDALEDGNNIDTTIKTKELYATLNVGDTTFTIGDKIVVWGEAESTAVTDIISPQNITDMVFTSLDESRISQSMLLVEHYANTHQLSLIVNPNIKFDEQPGIAIQNGLPREVDDKSFELGLRWKAPIGLGDFSLMIADVIDNSSIERYSNDINLGTVSISNYYKNYQMLGAAASLNLGNMALQIESAFNKNRAQELVLRNFDRNRFPDGYGVSDEILLAVNVNYQENGLRDWSAGILHTQYLDYSDRFLLGEESLNEIYFGVSNKFYHELVTIDVEYQYQIELEASIAYLSTSYSASDNFTLSIDVFSLDNIEGGFDQDSVTTRIIYNF